eukprot:TRINITY_DN5285_c0_g1_i1.p1 TRINITY_DN5285_c0_g1~~TRINITY_DN5285_c0_g1_i1.p1  ORF type:complete len:176 (-),score=30.28 TRINITY_DN5285_c0_g1_i1:453-980(-)
MRKEIKYSDEQTHKDILTTNFVTEKEFELALDIVMSCEFLSGNLKSRLTEEEMVAILNSEFSENNEVYFNLMGIIFDNIGTLLRRKPNKPQFSAFLFDILRIFNEERDIRKLEEGHIMEIDEHESESEWLAASEERETKQELFSDLKPVPENHQSKQLTNCLSFLKTRTYCPLAL